MFDNGGLGFVADGRDARPYIGRLNFVGTGVLDCPKVELLELGVIAEKYIKTIRGIEKYVVMPNHIHMIIKIENGTMWASSPTKLR